jgi:hypothetical protein
VRSDDSQNRRAHVVHEALESIGNRRSRQFLIVREFVGEPAVQWEPAVARDSPFRFDCAIASQAPVRWITLHQEVATVKLGVLTLPLWQRHGFFLSSQLLHKKGHEHSVLSSGSRHRLCGGEGFGQGRVSG